MKTISQAALKEIMEIYAEEKEHKYLRKAHDATGKERGWLQVQTADVSVLVHAREFIKSFDDERQFIYALGRFLLDHKLVPAPPNKKQVSSEPDFIDRLQDRVV